MTLDDIKREAFRRAGVSPSLPKTAGIQVDVEKLASRLESAPDIDPMQDDGMLYEYEQMFKQAQDRAAKRLGMVDGHLTLR